MLKFADLSVGNKMSSIDSYTKFFPNSYMPLLMMYLGRENLMEVKENVEESDPHTIIAITSQEIHSFFEGVNDLIKDAEKTIDITSIPLYQLFGYRDEVGLTNVGLCLNEKSSPMLINVLKILAVSDEQIAKVGKIYLFLLLWNIEWEAFLAYQYDEKEDEFTTEKWLSFFESSLLKIQAYSRDKIWMQPEELTKVVLAKKISGGMFNPFAGLASYSVNTVYDDDDFYTKEYSLGDSYLGQEIDMVSWAVGKIRLLAYRNDSKHYVISDSRLWTDQKYPNIMSTPPFGVKIMNEDGMMEFADHYVLRRSINTMDSHGMTACVVPASFLTRKDTYELRKRLTKERLLDTIVLLPEGTFLPYTNIKTAIVFLKNENNSIVKFVDASKYYVVKGRERKLAKKAVRNLILYNDFPEYLYHPEDLNLQEMKSVFLSSISLCRVDEIQEKDYSLNVNLFIRHGKNANEGFEELYLDYIFFPFQKDKDEIIKKTKPENHLEVGRLVTLDNLSLNPLFPYIDYTSLERVKFDESLEAIQGPAFLFSLHDELRISILRDDQMVFIPKADIAAFGYDPKEYYGEYIVNELFKPYVIDYMADMELEEIRTAEDIGLLKILIPMVNPYDWSQNRVSAQKDALIQERNRRIIKIEQQLSELKEKRNDDYIRSLRQRKHRIQQVMDQLCPAFSLLNKLMNEKGVLHNNDIIGRRTGKTTIDYFLLIAEAIDKVESMIDHIVDEDEWGESEFFKLSDFLDEIAQRNFSDSYSIKLNYNIMDGYGKDSILVSLNRDKFATVFENIISNAQKWGFVDENRNDYCIRIDVDKPTINSVRIRIANNGEPIHPSLVRSRIFEWGIGNHTGYGTWQIKNIIEHYLGTIELHEYPDDKAGFQTEYEIELPAYI